MVSACMTDGADSDKNGTEICLGTDRQNQN